MADINYGPLYQPESREEFEQVRDITVVTNLDIQNERRYSYDIQLPRGRYTAFRLQDTVRMPLYAAFPGALKAANGTTNADLAYIRRVFEEQPPAGPRKTLIVERGNLKVLTQSMMQNDAGTLGRTCYDRARLAYHLATVGRMLWSSWTNQTQTDALTKFSKAMKDGSCPDVAKEFLEASFADLNNDLRDPLALKPDENDLDDTDYHGIQVIHDAVDNVKNALNQHLLNGQVFHGAAPTENLVHYIEAILNYRVGWGIKVKILCEAMVVFLEKRFRLTSPALCDVQRTNERYLRGVL